MAFRTLLVLLVAHLWLGLARAETPPHAPAGEIELPLSEEQIRAAGIEISPIESERATGELVVPGVVVAPPTQIRVVAAPAAGLVETLLVAPDEEIKEGAPVAQLKSSELVEAQRAFLHAVSDADLAREKLRRDEQLFKERIIAERRLLVTRAETVQAESALDERRQLLALDGMDSDEIEALRRSRKLASALLVRAPVSGIVLQRHGSAGERVPASAPLVTIARLDPIWVNLQIPVGRETPLQIGQSVILPSLGVRGRLIRVGRTVDAATQSIAAVAEFQATKNLLRPGQAVQAILVVGGAGEPQWRIQADSVVTHHDQHFVFARDASGFRAVPVVLVAETPQYASIRGALKSGDRIATRGILTLLAELAAKEK
ncbi:efflux RND transporter periplasmic adaptor subunit [Methylocystis bryophila]|uniref:Efflux transporter periplasmic adaptor subunit n=1 Tax=Methylocystis bryophila TaxID=655015 RepID=A0A1W6MZF3_9HYPH|nr:efflux RND transporter periplasmic adaptor subunit [Methylocystis bryophila]ARN82961.1 efflux transporter periplasmic adaptor subunit [Methylocystis bryophila]BDV39249.1 secretion protein HlyD [Methylocystis bryophila]